MFKHYIKIAVRNLRRHKAFSVINIAGLAIGIAACLLIFTVVRYELSYDKSQANYKQIYQVVTQSKTDDGLNYKSGIPFPALDALRLEFPEITTGALCANYGSQVTVLGDKISGTGTGKKFIEETGFFFCDPEFFKVFHYDWLTGSPELLKEPNVTVLTQDIAEKYFGNWKDAIGKFLRLDNATDVKVVGILKDIPANTDFPLGIITSFETLKANSDTYFYSQLWGATTSNFQLFMLLPQNISVERVNSGLVTFSNKYYNPNDSRTTKRLSFLQPLSEVHFDNRFDSFGSHVIQKSTIWTLSLIGLFILIMACINFINLSTAQAIGRSREIGIRKVLGGHKWQLLRQVMIETIVIVLISALIAIIIAALCLPSIKHVAFIQEPLNLFNPVTISFLLGTILMVTLFAGLYPAMVLSGFKPVLALKNKITSATVGGLSVRRGLVISQFAISQVLVIGTIIAITQMSFVQNADLGFNKEALLIINSNNDSLALSRQEAFKQSLLEIPGVKLVTFTSDVPSSENESSTNFGFGHQPDPSFDLYMKFGDEDYFKTFGVQMLAGRGFDKSDTIKEVVVNETLVKRLGMEFADEIIGKEIRYGGENNDWKTIVGVVEDFKTNSLKKDINPLAIAERRESYTVTAVKLNSKNIPETRATVEDAWNEFYPEYAFTSNFLDDNIAEFYEQDRQLSLLFKIFAGIAIFISCLGLYGLVSFMAVQRTKEIGVRKVLGASVGNIIYLFSKEFMLLIIIGFVLAIPIGWYMMHEWLQNFVYRISITPGVFILAAAVSILIAGLAVGYKSVKAALANPIDSLRTE